MPVAGDPAHGSPFSWPTRVYWEDTDAGGVVYHAQYLAFLERARTEWLRALGHGQEQLREMHDLVFAVRAMRIDFRKPARLDDALEVSAALRQCRHASLVMAQAIHRDGELLLDAEVRVAALSARDFRPRAMPPALLEELEQHVIAPGADE
ncbi:tol-pal system-associated acyl-CoA thioesterase [Luteimonas aestuarii]|uniref:Tol-pal system-associated acyl-CoA thioesterase n=1 Tax=Luteimonas aestuarii TaxID=453837 RepID=A0A4R5TJD2_9GAMM|nr:tol-pal system-associated acyl-CoA thioesterase [Luteimonas aestuarii]